MTKQSYYSPAIERIVSKEGGPWSSALLRFREQQDYLDQRFKEMEEKLDALQALLAESTAAPDNAPVKPVEQPEANQ